MHVEAAADISRRRNVFAPTEWAAKEQASGSDYEADVFGLHQRIHPRLAHSQRDASLIKATFDLPSDASGTWDLVVDTSDGQTATLPQAFTIKQA